MLCTWHLYPECVAPSASIPDEFIYQLYEETYKRLKPLMPGDMRRRAYWSYRIDSKEEGMAWDFRECIKNGWLAYHL